MRTIAAIDIGSQTIRLMVAECTAAGDVSPVCRDRSIVRLGEGMTEDKKLKTAAMDRALECISGFVTKAIEHGASDIFPVATACVRTAVNGSLFVETVRKRTGLLPVVVSGEEEARLSLKGMMSTFPPGKALYMTVDIGGAVEEDDVNVSAFIIFKHVPLHIRDMQDHPGFKRNAFAQLIGRLAEAAKPDVAILGAGNVDDFLDVMVRFHRTALRRIVSKAHRHYVTR